MTGGGRTTTDRARTTITAAAVMLVCLSALAGSVSADEGLEGRLSATAPVELTGATETRTDHAAVGARTPHLETRLEAERIDTRIEWEEGYIPTQRPGGIGTSSPTGTGVDWHNFSSTHAQLASFSDIPQVSSLSGEADVLLSAETPGSVQSKTVHNKTVAKWGYTQDTGTAEAAGFYQVLEGSHVALTGADRATVTGNFTVFVNNVTIQVTHQEGTWSNWTGYREGNPDSPVGPLANPAAKTYEVRATTLHVTNGVLRVNATNAVDMYTREETTANVNGSVYAPSVSGELLREPLLYRYDGDPLQLWGQGSLDLGLASTSSGAAPPLALEAAGSFDVQPSDGVEVTDAETTSAWNPLSWFGEGAWLALSAVAIAVVGVAVGAVSSDRARAAVGAVLEGRSSPRYERLIRDAQRAMSNNDVGFARKTYMRALRLDASAPEAYRGLMVLYGRSNDLEKALAFAQAAAENVDRLPSELACLWATHAHRAGASDQVVDAWLELARVDPHEALVMYVEEDYEELQTNPRVRERAIEVKETLVQEAPELAARLKDRFNGSYEGLG